MVVNAIPYAASEHIFTAYQKYIKLKTFRANPFLAENKQNRRPTELPS